MISYRNESNSSYAHLHYTHACVYMYIYICIYCIIHIQVYIHTHIYSYTGFPHRSVGKSSACNAGEAGSIPGLGRSPREGNGNAITLVFLPGESHRQRSLAVHGVTRVGHDLATKAPPPYTYMYVCVCVYLSPSSILFE